jgi:sRNA-binding carbon storage regulator CsrA
MLVMRRKEGQWIQITHSSGDRIRIRVYNIRSRYPGHLDLAFNDPAHQFTIRRGERAARANRCLS